MAKNLKEIVIPKEKALFRLDKHGFWHNKHGKFQHKKIIDYFHTCIEKDGDGFYLIQERDNYIEKVYFPYEETAYFVFDVSKNNEEVVLTLNTKKQIKLNPDELFIREDDLYLTAGDDLIKFTEHTLMQISDLLEFEEDKYFIRLNDKRYDIKKRKESGP
jgi:hypothetical protein